MGFPSPAKDYAEAELSLDELCIKSKTATFFMRAEGNYPRVGIFADCILVIDRSRQPIEGSIVVADVDGRFRICMMQLSPPALKSLTTLEVIKGLSVDSDFGESTEIFGVVTYAVNNMTTFEFDDVPV